MNHQNLFHTFLIDGSVDPMDVGRVVLPAKERKEDGPVWENGFHSTIQHSAMVMTSTLYMYRT